ncbi:unnamed protein product, partial [Brassica oleracea var. botrytis]
SNVLRTGLIGESSQTYVSRTGFRRRSGAICGGGIEIQASHPMDLAPLPVEGEADGGRGVTRRRRYGVALCECVTVYERDGALSETEQHDVPSTPAIYFLMAALETIQDIDLGYLLNNL